MPLPRVASQGGDMRSLYNLFRVNPGAFPGVNPGAFNDAANEDAAIDSVNYKATSPEMQREQDMLGAADQRAEIGIRGDLAEAQQVRQARDLGYDGSLPLKQKAEADTRSALAKVLLPKQMELEAAARNQAATREFTASENDQNRLSRESIAQGSQQGQNQRMIDRSADVAARSVKAGSNPLRWLLSPTGLVDSNAAVQAKEQQRVRDQVKSQMSGVTGSSVMVPMIAPDGGPLSVPEDRVTEMEAHGARRQ